MIEKKYRRTHPDMSKQACIRWRDKNPDKVKEMRRIQSQRIRSILKGRLNARMGSAIWRALRGAKNGRNWESLVGYSVIDLTKHLESQFKDGMSWDNMGRWHLDHIVPQSRFHFETADESEFKVCWALVNLQPLWAKDNFVKSDMTMAEWKAKK